MMSRFEQPSFQIFCNMEQILLKGINGEDPSAEVEEFSKIHGDDVDLDVLLLRTELEVMKSICEKNNPSHALEVI